MAVQSLQLRSLESRVTPAAAYTSTLVGGILTLTGTDEDESIILRDDGVGVTVFGQAGTTIDGLGAVTFAGAVNSIKIIGKGGNDRVGLDPDPLELTGALDIDLGDGNNTFSLQSFIFQPHVGSVKLKAGEGFDFVDFPGFPWLVAGDFTADLKNGGTNVQLTGGTTINGKFDVKTGIGNDQLYLAGIVKKDFNYSTGDGGANLYLGNGTTIDGSMSMISGAGNETISIYGATIKGPKGLNISGGYGSTQLTLLNSPSTLTTGGVTVSSIGDLASLDTSAGLTTPGAITISGLGAVVNTNAAFNAKSLTITGPQLAELKTTATAAATNITGNVTLSSKFGDAKWSNFDGTLTVGGKTNVSGGADAVLSLESTNTTTLTGDIRVTAKTGIAVLQQSDSAFAFGGNVAVKSPNNTTATLTPTASSTVAGNMDVKSTNSLAMFMHLGSNNLTINKALNISGLTNATLFGTSTGNFTVNGAAKVAASTQAGAAMAQLTSNVVTLGNTLAVSGATTHVTLQPTTSGSVAGMATVTGGTNGLTSSSAKVNYAKNLTFTGGVGTANISLSDVTIAGNLGITTGGGDDTVDLSDVQVTGTTTIKTNGGGDSVILDDESVFTGVSMIDTGSGDDFLSFGTTTGLASYAVTFTGKATIKAGTGNDQLFLGTSLGNGGNAFSLASFAAGSTVAGGTNFNLFDDELGQFIGGPTFSGWTDPTP